MFRLWIERRFSRPVTAAGTVRIGPFGGTLWCCRYYKGPLMKHSSLPRRILLVLAGTLALPASAVGQYLHDYCHTD